MHGATVKMCNAQQRSVSLGLERIKLQKLGEEREGQMANTVRGRGYQDPKNSVANSNRPKAAICVEL